MNKKIIIIGAGLSGSLLALRLAQRGFEVDVYERRPDMRRVTISAGRSINLALSDRGIRGLHLVGLENELLELAIPMPGRMIHMPGQQPVFSPYSGRQGEYINSISRGELNMALLNKAETYPGIRVFFNAICERVDLQTPEAFFIQEETGEKFSVRGEVIIGTDGAGSALRNSMMNDRSLRFNYSQAYLEHGYKELNIPPADGGGFRIEKNALHIWPRGSFMLIALPNRSGDFTATLFMSYTGEYGFDAITDEKKLHQFFEELFPDLPAHIPDLSRQYFSNPVGWLGTIKCYPWQAYGKTLLLGDSAHAIVPFYGQGMNCAFEDVVVLDEMLNEYGDNWQQILPAFQQSRKQNTDAIADLAVDNFCEMRDLTADPVFQKKRKLETRLEKEIPQYFSKYSMVTFREDLPYHSAMVKGRKQDELLMEICRKTDEIDQVSLEEVLRVLNNE